MYSHLWVEDAAWGLDNSDGLVVELHGEDLLLGVLDDGGQVQGQVLWVHLVREAVGESLTLAGGDEGSITSGGQVANDARWAWSSWNPHWREERTADELEADWGWLFIVDGQHALSWVVVD